MSMPSLLSARMAPLGGNFSWSTPYQFEQKFNNKKYHFSIQTPRCFSIISSRLYKAWRIVMRKDSSIVGCVISEHDTESDVLNAAINIQQLFEGGFVKFVEGENDLQHGDVISVPTKMWKDARHFGIYDKFRGEVIEYQSVRSKNKGRIRATPFDDFEARVREDYDGAFELAVHEYLPEITLDRKEVVKRARGKIGSGKYGAVSRNCESFALWAKTTKTQSAQSVTNIETAVDWTIKIAEGIALVAIITAMIFLMVIAGITEAIVIGFFIFHEILFMISGFMVCILLGIGTVCLWIHRCISNGHYSFDFIQPELFYKIRKYIV